MNINLMIVGVLALALSAHMMYAFFTLDRPRSELPWVPISVGKQRSFVNKTRDAGMFTEQTRRVAIISNNDPVFRSHKGSTNGSLEWYFLTAICTCDNTRVCPKHFFEVAKGGSAADETCEVLDLGGDAVLDLNEQPLVCE